LKLEEFQVAEAIHCPSCSTRYRLRPERLKPVIRRAQCFSCGGIFPVGDIVQRLLALPLQSDTSRFMIEDVAAAQHVPLEHAVPPPLTLGDLEGVEAEILEKTLVEAPTSLPETKADVAPAVAGLPEPTTPPITMPVVPAFPPEITESTLSGYTSARDAIDKLLGQAPAAPSGLKLPQEPSDVEMEATLSVLDTTLGGTRIPPISATETKGDSPTASGLTEEDLAGPSSSTMRLSQADLMAVLATPIAPKASQEPTVALKATDLLAPPDEATALISLSPQRTVAALAEPPEAGAELLRLKIGEEIYPGLTMPQLTAWVEEGRILENHLVARQHSENWLEAHKVPGLRPVFERLRRERSGGAFSLDPGTGEIAPKKSLFGGLFGKP
jgi:hypothetical protein